MNTQEPEGVGEYSYVNKTSHGETVGYVNTANTDGATYVNARDVGGAGYVNTADSGGTGYVNTNDTNDPSHYENKAVCQRQAKASAANLSHQPTGEYEIMTSPTAPYESIKPTDLVVPGEHKSLGNAKSDEKHVYEAANSKVTSGKDM